MNKVCGINDEDFIVVGDIDLVYVCVDKVIEKVGFDWFKE